MNMKKLVFFIVSLLFFSCIQKRTPVYEQEDPQMMNEGYLFDSAAYEAEMMEMERKYERTVHLRTFRQLDLYDVPYYKICERFGKPRLEERYNLDYGFYKKDSLDMFYHFGMVMYLNSEWEPIKSQRYYRASKILNHPNMNVLCSIWRDSIFWKRDSISYRELYFIINGKDTTLFDGFQAQPSFMYGI